MDPTPIVPDGIAEALRAGGLPTDAAFDRHLPRELRELSRMYWTPMIVARRAARWVEAYGAASVLDVGSGAGKFCVVGALCSKAHYVGIEHRPRLVSAASELARTFGVEDRATFVAGALGDVELPPVDAIYLYNPFGENLYGFRDCIDEDVELGHERYVADVRRTEALLRGAPLGTLLVSYNGFGGHVPGNFVEREVDRTLPCVLRLHEKVQIANDAPDRLLDSHDDLHVDTDDAT